MGWHGFQLVAELREWDDPEARDLTANLHPLKEAALGRLEDWLHIVRVTPPDVRSPDALTHRHSVRRSVRQLTDMAQLCVFGVVVRIEQVSTALPLGFLQRSHRPADDPSGHPLTGVLTGLCARRSIRRRATASRRR
ncbi:MAG: hypothetical protein ABSD89_13940 [Halobacteriota archaeon]|jgi:hypothetical protein